jgi:hypothetical protein
MRRPSFTVLAVFSGLTLLQACGHGGPGGPGGGPGTRMMGGPGGPHAPSGPGMSPSEGAQLKAFDLDGDERLARDELERALRVSLATYDTDKDTFLSAVEARALNDQRRKESRTASPVFDWNADGHVDFKEFANQQLALFDRLDADNDRVLTEQEMLRPAMGPPGGMRGGSGAQGRGSGRSGGGR